MKGQYTVTQMEFEVESDKWPGEDWVRVCAVLCGPGEPLILSTLWEKQCSLDHDKEVQKQALILHIRTQIENMGFDWDGVPCTGFNW